MSIDKNLLLLAIINKKIKPYLQPIINDNFKIKGFEVLARWERFDNVIIFPSDFLDILRDDEILLEKFTISLIEQLIDFFVFKKIDDIELHINIYSVSLSPHVIERLLVLNKLAKVVIEILEDDVIISECFIYKMLELRLNGIQFAIDDFGCGFNNTERLDKYKFDILKIDKKFISAIDNNISKYNLVKNIVSLSDANNFKLIAEGVEKKEEFEILRRLGIKYFQGFLFYKAMPLNKVDEIMFQIKDFVSEMS